MSLLFTSAAVVAMMLSFSQARFIIGELGLIHSLPISFFIALAFLTFASAILWLSPQYHGKLLCLQTCLLITGLWLTPLIITGFYSYPYVRADHPYRFYGFTDYIAQWGHLNPGLLSYHGWPAAWLLSATVIVIYGINDPVTMIALTPFLMQFLYLFPLYLFFRNIFGRNNYCWAGVWLFYLGNWMGQSYLGAHSFSIILFLNVLALLTKTSASQQGINGVVYQLISIGIFVGLTITHLVSSFVVLSGLIVLYIGRKIKSFITIMFATLFFAFWLLYWATYSFKSNLPVLIDAFLRLDMFAYHSVEAPLTITSEAHRTVAMFRILTTVIFIVIAFTGFIIGRKIKRNTSNDRIILLMAMSFTMAPIILGPGIFLEVPERIFIYILPLIAYFGAKMLAHRTTAIVFCSLLLILLPLFFICNYGNAIIDHLSPVHIVALHFFEDNTSEGYITGGYALGYKKTGQGIYDYTSISFDKLQWKDNKLIYNQTFQRDRPHRPHFISISRHDEAWYDFNYNKPWFIRQIQQQLNMAVNVNLIYSNPDLSLYINENP